MKLCVIMSIYKNDNLLAVTQSIESILRQAYEKIEFYIQLDGEIRSDVLQYLRGLCIQDIRVKILNRTLNRGLAYSLNELLNIVLTKEYEYIARMDADDISMPERFVKQIAFMNSHPDIDCLGTWAIEIDDDGKEYFRKKMPITHEECLELFKKRDCMIHPTVMFRRSYFEKAGLYPEDTYFGEDTMMWAKGFKSGCKFANVPEYLFKFRLDSNFFERRRGWKHAKFLPLILIAKPILSK
jgi:glycosyltransferase involved in cell wall biosynthesis